MTVHSRYGGSIIGTIIGCAGYLNATSHIKDDESAPAKLGTAAHNTGEFCLKAKIMDASFLIGSEFNGCVVDEDMADGVNVYLKYIRDLLAKHPDAIMRVEPKVRMSSAASDDANIFGYVDCLIHIVADGVLYVIDFKYGFGIVDVNDNSQIAHYSISSLDTYKLWFTVNKVVGVIIQPRKEHYDGVVRTVDLTIDDLMKWRDVIVDAVRASKVKDAKRKAGVHCHYCEVRGECRTRMLRTVSLVTSDNGISNMTDEEIAVVLPELPAMIKNIESIKERALTLGRAGKHISGYKLVRGNAQAICTDVDSFIKEMKVVNPDFDEGSIYYPGRVKGKTELKKKQTADIKKVVDKYFPAPDTNSQLVPLSNPKSAISTNASQAFKGIIL